MFIKFIFKIYFIKITYRFIFRIIYKSANEIIVNSKKFKELLKKNLDLKANFIYNPMPKILKTKKEIVKKVDVLKEKLIVETKNINNKLKRYVCDIVINVSGPLNVGKIKNEIPLVKSLKQNGSKTNDKGFIVSDNFEIGALKNIYIPGILARGFNPERKTIIKAILENSNTVGQSIAKTLIRI